METKPLYISILQQFNDKDPDAFGEIYRMYYAEFTHFASTIYRDTEINACDVVHDIFVKIWQSKELKFDTYQKIKAYVYICIKNNFKNYYTHKTYVDKLKKTVASNQDLLICEIVDSEIYSAVNQMLDLLPEDCAEVFKHIVDGYDIKEIAEKMCISERTVYNRKYEAIEILKQKLPKDALTILFVTIFGS